MASAQPTGNIKSETDNSAKENTKEDFYNKDCSSIRAVTSERSYVKSLDHMFYDTIDGVNYYSVTKNGRVKNQLPITLGLDLRCDDVILCGYPKSGNHWIFEVLTMILHQNTDFNERVFHLNMLEFLNEEVQSVLNAIKSPRHLTTHLRCHRLPLQVAEKRLKIVYLLRNPKDIVVSLYCMFSNNEPPYMRYNGTFDEFFDLYIKGEFFWGFWFDHVWSYEHFLNQNSDYPVFILSYERMKQEPITVIRDLCAFLQKPDVLAEDIVRATEFTNMKSTLLNGKMKHIAKLVFQVGKDFIFRKGEIGDWRNWFSAHQSETFDLLFEEKMAGSKLADKVREYM